MSMTSLKIEKKVPKKKTKRTQTFSTAATLAMWEEDQPSQHKNYSPSHIGDFSVLNDLAAAAAYDDIPDDTPPFEHVNGNDGAMENGSSDNSSDTPLITVENISKSGHNGLHDVSNGDDDSDDDDDDDDDDSDDDQVDGTEFELQSSYDEQLQDHTRLSVEEKDADQIHVCRNTAFVSFIHAN